MLPDHRRWSDLEDTRAALAHPTMEAAETGARQSGILSLINQDRNSKESYDRAYTTSMAAAAVISPTTSMYSNGPPPPYSSGWPAPPPPSHALSGLLSPPESRRTSDNKNEPPSLQTQAPHRQSLPSIHEALNSGPKPTPSYVSPVTSHPPQQPQQHQQSPYTQGPPIPPRSYPEPAPYSQAPPQPRHASPPHPIHPQNPFSRPEPIPASYPENRHASSASLQAAPAPPHNPYAAPPPQAPRFDAPRYEQDSRPQERLQPNGYSSHPPPPQEPYGYAPSTQRDSGYPPSHTPHAGMHDQSRYPPRDDRQSGEWSRGGMDEKRNAPFVVNMKRHLDIWDFENNLSQIHTCSNKIRDWSAHYELIAQEQQRTVTYPERMPNLDECNEMLAQNKKIHDALQWMRETIYQQEHAAMADQRMREQGGKDYEADEMSMYGDDLKTQGFGGSESKKRRGRAAPPGRCHSCNRAETPEWRRGPDGARTLCNACGLHYAKLTRKNHNKQLQGSNGSGSTLRPKSMDDHSPRPL